VKWQFLEHKGPLFAPAYERLPDNVRFWYDGKVSYGPLVFRTKVFPGTVTIDSFRYLYTR
jgi:hypothetical protein